MRKRPMCLACLLLLLGMLLFSSGASDKDADRKISGNDSVSVEGQVYKREEKANSLQIYLKNISIIQPGQTGSQNTSQPENAENYGAMLEKSNLLIRLDKNQNKIKIGTYVRAAGILKEPEKATNPGQFDFARYYAAKGIYYILDDARTLAVSGSYDLILETLCSLRETLAKKFDEIGGEDAGFLQAMLLGEKSNLEEEMKDLYQLGGISHILAISGLHISLLGMALYKWLRKHGTGFLCAGLISGLLMAAYCVMTGFGVSAKRALLMYLVYLGAQIFGRTYDLLSGLAFSAVVILTGSPELLGDVSFLLSFLAILGLGTLQPLIASIFHVNNKIILGILSGAAIQIITVPVSLWFFYETSLFGLVLNLIVLPLLPLVLAFGAAGAAVGFISIKAGIICFAPCHYLLKLYELLCRLAASLPGSRIVLGQPEIWQLFVYYGLIAGLFLGARIYGRFTDSSRVPGCLGGAAFLAALGTVLVLDTSSGLRITFLDVGQGDGICIQSDTGKVYFIDGGSSSEKSVGKYRIIPFLKYYGISYLDGLILTHGDEDHINGARELIEGKEGIGIGCLILPDVSTDDEIYRELESLAKERRIPVQYLNSGMSIQEKDGLSLVCLHPAAGYKASSRNGESSVIMLSYGSFRALFTGDLEEAEERMLLRQQAFSRVDVLKAAHHGSKNSTTDEFLQVTRPEAAVISCGEGNRYGHPHKELLLRLGEAGCRSYLTKDLGAVQVVTDGDRYTLSCGARPSGRM
ncbi:DNA internalization-related competence protein ComEC/Rec2 [Murimonas intestini]|uniref:Competence protein ComEC n=1 Tax=Murimonas intestini TaxID=1337051 RepID=A0AB73T947_9FIRM|nr:DNA internalization-related competence protein ComEC/Rec2 [Murimonas intestini]MCR1839418.1 DNA internalization-related competence protein ComEC/Rec2 [Murimonas intestini]MCR1864713.1 DNA internalization-related competence protein ComEC/Rec2 [Murimonas intestini]MCR1882323.1 DNA internalization-related competence protein ComEC/Rec2 [Murimonas intestini]